MSTFHYIANELYSEEEGLIVSLLITRSTNPIEEKDLSQRFTTLFNDYAEGHAIVSQEELIQNFLKLLPPQLLTLIQRPEEELPDEFEWYQQYFIQYSAT